MLDTLFYFRVLVIISWLAGLMLFCRIKTVNKVEAGRNYLQNRRVSIIIPARNEEKNIPFILKNLENQTYNNFEVIVVDDNSKDKTKSLAEDFNIKVISLTGDPPRGWIGKSWACWQGYIHAEGEIFIFLDADVQLSPGAVDMLLTVQNKYSGLISVQPHHVMKKRYEHFSFMFNLVTIAAMRVFSAWAPLVKPTGAFGPCIICEKRDYEKAGTHFKVRKSVLDDIELGKAFIKQHIPVNNFLGGESISFRMYPESLFSLVEGWSKNFAVGARSLDIFTLMILFLWITGMLYSGFALFRGEYFPLQVVVYLLFVFQLFIISRKIGNFGLLTPIVYLPYLLFFCLIFLLSMIRTFLFRSVSWKERRIYID